jgi:hypothetical protein
MLESSYSQVKLRPDLTPNIDMAKSFIDRFQAASARELSRQSRQRRNGGGGGGGGCLLLLTGIAAAALLFL